MLPFVPGLFPSSGVFQARPRGSTWARVLLGCQSYPWTANVPCEFWARVLHIVLLLCGLAVYFLNGVTRKAKASVMVSAFSLQSDRSLPTPSPQTLSPEFSSKRFIV